MRGCAVRFPLDVGGRRICDGKRASLRSAFPSVTHAAMEELRDYCFFPAVWNTPAVSIPFRTYTNNQVFQLRLCGWAQSCYGDEEESLKAACGFGCGVVVLVVRIWGDT